MPISRNGKLTRVSTKDFNGLENKTDGIIASGKQDIEYYIQNNKTKKMEADTLESLTRNTLEDVLDEVSEWFIDTFKEFEEKYNVKKHKPNLPKLDQLLYRKNGWTLSKSIKWHLQNYNKWRKKEDLVNSLNNIIETESIRLRNMVFDTMNENTGCFPYVTITGDKCCSSHKDKHWHDEGLCESHYGTFRVGIDFYDLPPYYPICHCYAIYHDNPDLEVD